ncbi:Sucrase/ferredoxin-like-domain-containing protein [Trametes punicea]|nr:Sucrase/ferredoxin-like-domain-containing protein [Trametes punicea]
MLTLAPTLNVCRRAPSRLIRHRLYAALRDFSSSPTRASALSSLAGTAPFHTAYVLLHTHDPPSSYPARSTSPLWRAFTMKARQWGGTVNFVWSPALRPHPAYTGLGEEPEAKQRHTEVYSASVFSIAHRHGRLEIPELSLANLDDVDEKLRALVAHAASRGGKHAEIDGTGGEGVRELEGLDRRLHLYVCTHGARDCRCGEGGNEVARAFRRELAKRGIGAKDVVLGEVAHVGGHKYAANVLVYPYGDWLGTVQAFDVPALLDEILAWHARHQERVAQSAGSGQDAKVEMPPLCPPFWRGRMGFHKEEQIALFQRAA